MISSSTYRLLGQAVKPESWRLLLRTLDAALTVRRALPGRNASPRLGPAIRAVELVYLPPQPGWAISEPRLIIAAARLVTTLPRLWGRCVQQSLITYRLLNAYGIPSRICYGVSTTQPDERGHAWVRTIDPANQWMVGSPEPLDQFQVVFISAVPASGAFNPDGTADLKVGKD